jgi:hypothetical protein
VLNLTIKREMASTSKNETITAIRGKPERALLMIPHNGIGTSSVTSTVWGGVRKKLIHNPRAVSMSRSTGPAPDPRKNLIIP